MTGLLLITHNRIGRELLESARVMLGKLPLSCHALSIDRDDDPDQIISFSESITTELESGDGILILTDVIGSTPCNIAGKIAEKCNANVVTGVNLPMLIRLFNYADLPLDKLTEKAISGGKDGVEQCQSGGGCF